MRLSVASSNAAALPEVCGDGARLFDPTSVEAMVEAVEDILARPDEWRADAASRGPRASRGRRPPARTTPCTQRPTDDQTAVTFGAVATTLTERLRASPPGIHGAGNEYWGLAWPALEWLEGRAPGGHGDARDRARERARSSSPQQARITSPSRRTRTRRSVSASRVPRAGVSSDRVSFEVGFSHDVLPRLADRAARSRPARRRPRLPVPVLDWWYLAPRLKVGGRMLLDDAYMPPVAVVVDHARSSKAWDIEHAVSYRTVVLRKLTDELPPFDWEGERLGGHMTFRYLPPAERAVASSRHRIFSTRARPRARRALSPGLGPQVEEDGLEQRPEVRPRLPEATRTDRENEHDVERETDERARRSPRATSAGGTNATARERSDDSRRQRDTAKSPALPRRAATGAPRARTASTARAKARGRPARRARRRSRPAST